MPTTPVTFIAWTGTDTQLNVLQLGETGQMTLSDARSDNGPALAFYKNKLYLAWTGTDQQLNVGSYDSTQWSLQSPLGQYSKVGPALVAFAQSLCLVWTGRDSNGSINLMAASEGTNWGNPITITPKTQTTSLAPAAAVVPFQVPSLAWITPTGQVNLGIGQVGPTNASSSYGPALAFFNNLLYLAWVSNGGGLNLRSSADGITWAPITGMPPLPVSMNGPALAASGNSSINMAWTATSQQIYMISMSSAGVWGSAASIPDHQSNLAPALAAGSFS